MRKHIVFFLFTTTFLLSGCANEIAQKYNSITSQLTNKSTNESISESIKNNTTNLNNANLENINNWKAHAMVECNMKYSYPKSWMGDFGYLSPTKLDFYGEYGREPNNAAIRMLTLVENDDPSFQKANYMTRKYREYMSKIERTQRKNPDEDVIIDGHIFKKYDLINYSEYNGNDYENVIILISPRFNDINSRTGKNWQNNYVFEWHEYPGGQKMEENSKDLFLDIISTIEFSGDKCLNEQ